MAEPRCLMLNKNDQTIITILLLVALLKPKFQCGESRLLWQQKLLWRNGALFVPFL